MEKAIVTNGLRPKWISIDVWFFCRDITFRATGHMWPSVFCKRVQNNIERVHECHSRLGQVAHYFGYITIGMELLLLSDGFVFALCCFIALLSSSNWTVVSWSDAQWSMTISSWGKKRKRTTPLHFVPLLLPEFHPVVTASILHGCKDDLIT